MGNLDTVTLAESAAKDEELSCCEDDIATSEGGVATGLAVELSRHLRILVLAIH